MMAVAIAGGASIEAGTPARPFSVCAGAALDRGSPAGEGASYDVSADGSQFLTICGGAGSSPSVVTVALDWSARIK